jgi:CheY-like chemotaxis protein
MPGMSGIEVYEEARKIAGSIATRTVLITGDLMDAETKARIERIGLPAISKPFELKDILHTLGRILSRGL